ncbi:MAG TPA: DNA cytosine methyltransferase [Solirubrobacterales bacterium]|nr:DNA cytosine methyltransferase [Solirubrobacterales bacterium]
MNVGSLFSGIGGFDLGFERAGMRVSWQVELDPYCQAVLARHFPDAARFADVREVGARNLDPVDLLCGGFPCQDLSAAGRGAGIDGARSGLWSEFARIVRELRPRYVVVENVPALLTGKGKRWERGPIGRVLGDLAEARYDAEWACLSAGEFGAPHLRKRVWIVAYPARDAEAGAAAESGSQRQRAWAGGERSRAAEVADADAKRQPGRAGALRSAPGRRQPAERGGKGADVPDADRQQHEGRAQALGGSAGAELRDHWAAEPGVGRVADGVPRRVDRLAALGNALVPQIAEWIGRRILDYERRAAKPREGAMI